MPPARVISAEIYYEESETGLRSPFPPADLRARWPGTGRWRKWRKALKC